MWEVLQCIQTAKVSTNAGKKWQKALIWSLYLDFGKMALYIETHYRFATYCKHQIP